MKRAMALVLIICITFTLPFYSASAESENLIVQAQREVEIMKGGVILLDDTFTIKASEGVQETISEFVVGFQDSIVSERRSFYMWDGGQWESLSFADVQFDNQSIYGYQMELPSPIQLGEDTELKLKASYLFITSVSPKTADFEANLPVHPLLFYNISSYTLEIKLPEDAEYKDATSPVNFTQTQQGAFWTLNYESNNVAPMATETASIVYDPAPEDEYLLGCESLQLGVTIGPDSLRFSDGYTLENRGGVITSFHIKLPKESSNIKAHDGVGPLTVTWDEAEGGESVDASVTPRSAFRVGNKWGFTIDYSLPKQSYVAGSGGNQALTFPDSVFPHFVRELSAMITLPEGGSLIDTEPIHSEVNPIGNRKRVLIELGPRLPSEWIDISVQYSSNSLTPLLRPVGLIVGIVVIAAIVVVLNKRRPVEEKAPEKAEKPRLDVYIDQYDQRVGLLNELLELERDLEAKKISRESFDQRSVEVNRNLENQIGSIRRLGQSLEEAFPDLKGNLREIKKVEDELEKIDNDLKNLELRLRARRISRRDYQRRRRDSIKRRIQAVRRIGQMIESIRKVG
jgi:hypothetical protein